MVYDPQRVSEEDAQPRLSSLLTNQKLPFAFETILLIVLSAADVLLTNRLIGPGGRHVEANPIALWVLGNWGMRGMVIYKFILIAFICTLAQIIAVYRKPAGLLVMWVAVIAHALVVLYSIFQVLGQ